MNEEIFGELFHFFATTHGFFRKPFSLKRIYRNFTLLYMDYPFEDVKKAIAELEEQYLVYTVKSKIGLTSYGIKYGLNKFDSFLYWDCYKRQAKEVKEKTV